MDRDLRSDLRPGTAAAATTTDASTERERERVALLDRDLPVDLAAWTTLDDLPTAELRDAVAHIQSLLDRESVARCVQALWRYNGDPRGAIDWLVRSSQ